MLKTRVDEAIEVGSRSLAGDACADLEHHGSPDQAICLYPASHWPGLRAEGPVGKCVAQDKEGGEARAPPRHDRPAVVLIQPLKMANKVLGQAGTEARLRPQNYGEPLGAQELGASSTDP